MALTVAKAENIGNSISSGMRLSVLKGFLDGLLLKGLR